MSEMYPEPSAPEPLAVERYICLACGMQFSALYGSLIPPHTRSAPVAMVSGERFQINCEGSGSLPSVRTVTAGLPADPWATPDPGGVVPSQVPGTRLGLVAEAMSAAAQQSPSWREGDRMIIVMVSGDDSERSLRFHDAQPERAAQELYNAAGVMLASHPGPWRYVIGRVCSN